MRFYSDNNKSVGNNSVVNSRKKRQISGKITDYSFSEMEPRSILAISSSTSQLQLLFFSPDKVKT